MQVGETIVVVNNDFFEGETGDNIMVDKIINENTIEGRLQSDWTIRCLVRRIHNRWEIIENI